MHSNNRTNESLCELVMEFDIHFFISVSLQMTRLTFRLAFLFEKNVK
jgi:hypothetical protein